MPAFIFTCIFYSLFLGLLSFKIGFFIKKAILRSSSSSSSSLSTFFTFHFPFAFCILRYCRVVASFYPFPHPLSLWTDRGTVQVGKSLPQCGNRTHADAHMRRHTHTHLLHAPFFYEHNLERTHPRACRATLEGFVQKWIAYLLLSLSPFAILAACLDSSQEQETKLEEKEKKSTVRGAGQRSESLA